MLPVDVRITQWISTDYMYISLNMISAIKSIFCSVETSSDWNTYVWNVNPVQVIYTSAKECKHLTSDKNWKLGLTLCRLMVNVIMGHIFNYSRHTNYYQQRGNISSRFSSHSETKVSEWLKNLYHYMHSDVKILHYIIVCPPAITEYSISTNISIMII